MYFSFLKDFSHFLKCDYSFLSVPGALEGVGQKTRQQDRNLLVQGVILWLCGFEEKVSEMPQPYRNQNKEPCITSDTSACLLVKFQKGAISEIHRPKLQAQLKCVLNDLPLLCLPYS